MASFYKHPRASGSVAAHKTLPIGSQVRVRNLENGRSAVVTVIDRGPYVRGRVLDVSPSTAANLGFRTKGVARVQIRAISPAATAIPQAASASTKICESSADSVEHVDSGSDGNARLETQLECRRMPTLALLQPWDDALSTWASPEVPPPETTETQRPAAASPPAQVPPAAATQSGAVSVPPQVPPIEAAKLETGAAAASAERARHQAASRRATRRSRAAPSNPLSSLFARLRHAL